MTDEIRLAFAHPSERAAASTDIPYDRISLRDYVVEVEIGAFQQERGTRQRIRFNVVVEVLPMTGPIDDDVDRILSYDRVTEAIQAELGADRINLLETLAARVAERILAEPQAERVFVRIEKLDRGPYSLGVEIMRARDGTAPPAQPHTDAPHPRVLFVTNAAIGGDDIGTRIDAAGQDGAPVIVCVGPADVPAPQAGHPLAQRRIDLLSIEQNAWVLAARAPKCKVVETRTELDWAMKNGQICIWAPSKIVLDAPGGNGTSAVDALTLANWFAADLAATQMIVMDADQPDAIHAVGGTPT